jgi:hypothetical protein
MTKARDIASAAPAPSTVSATELGYLDGVSSAIQTQIDGKQAANANVSTTELGYLDGVTSAIQTQLDGKTAKNTLTTTGDIYYASSANTPARLGIGSSSQVLTVSGGVPTWATPAGGGLTFIGATTFTSTATINVNDVFSSNYENYRVVGYGTNSTTSTNVIRMRVSGSDTTANYASIRIVAENANLATDNDTSGTDDIFLGTFSTSTDASYFSIEFARPYLSTSTAIFTTQTAITGGYRMQFVYGHQTDSTSFTGFTILNPQGYTMTGKLFVFGYQKA